MKSHGGGGSGRLTSTEQAQKIGLRANIKRLEDGGLSGEESES